MSCCGNNFFALFKVGGKVYGLRESRSAALQGPQVPAESNVLLDGTLIDLCGATLLWRSAEGWSPISQPAYLFRDPFRFGGSVFLEG